MGKKLSYSHTQTSPYADVAVTAGWGGDFVHGEKGRAACRSGAKTHIRRRIRFVENMALKKELKNLDSE